MQALYISGPGKVQLTDVPVAPLAAGECRVRVKLAGICRTDLELARGYMGFQGVPGHEFVGMVCAGSSEWLGKRVVGEINAACEKCEACLRGMQRHCPNRTVLGIFRRPGAFAETLDLPVQNLLQVPDNVSDEAAVFTEPLAAVLEIFEQLDVPDQQRVLVIGDGKLGLLIAQVFVRRGHRVTLRGRHAKKLELAKKWGARIETSEAAGPEKFPLVVEATGSPAGFQAALESILPRGTLVLKSTYAPGQEPKLDAAKIVVDELTLLGSRCGRFEPALNMLAEGTLQLDGLIEQRFPLSRGAEAFAAAERKGAVKVLLECQPASRC